MTGKLIELLAKYIQENKTLKEQFGKCKTNEALYQELINVLNDVDISSYFIKYYLWK